MPIILNFLSPYVHGFIIVNRLVVYYVEISFKTYLFREQSYYKEKQVDVEYLIEVIYEMHTTTTA